MATKRDGGCGRSRGRGRQHKQSQRSSKYKGYAEVPEEQMGLVIGKGHRGLQQISTNTGAYVFTKREVSNRVFLQADKEDAIERAKQEISRIVSVARRNATASEERTFAIDPEGLEDDYLLLQQMKIPGREYTQYKYFRFVPRVSPHRLKSRSIKGIDHIADLMRDAEGVLSKIRRDADERPDASPLEIDMWFHLGHLLLTDVDDREATLPLSIQSVLSRVNKGPNFRRCFEAGVVDLDVDWLHQLLADSSDRKFSSVRHDIGFHTPSGQDRRFKIWISEDDKLQVASSFFEDTRAIGSAVVKVGQGTLSTNFNPRLRADIALPAHKFDCRLLIRTGIADRTVQKENEREEDSILAKRFCEKVRVSGKDLILPPLSELPDGYMMHFKRKSERMSYGFSGFELTTSLETFARYDAVDHAVEQHKVDIHVHSIECEKLLDHNGGRDWRPLDVVRFIPEMLTFVKEELSLLE